MPAPPGKLPEGNCAGVSAAGQVAAAPGAICKCSCHPALGLSTEQELQHKAQISFQRGTAEVPSLRESFKTSWNNFMG